MESEFYQGSRWKTGEKMRDTKRIKRICKKIEQLWSKTPDWRFGQFLINHGLIRDDLSSWGAECDLYEKRLDEKLKVKLK
jgi:hypothetical protein